MREQLTTLARRASLIALAILTALAIPAAILSFASEMPSYHRAGILWQPWMVIAYIALDLTAIALFLRFRRHWVSWALAAAVGMAPFFWLFIISR